MKTTEQLSLDLIEAQYALKNARGTQTGKSLLILVSGIELAGKGEAVKQLREWVDPRYLRVKADTAYLLNHQQPFWQPYVSDIPREGQVTLLFGNWYSDLLATSLHVSHPFDENLFDTYIEKMRAFEQDLKNNHVDIIKFWFDLPWKTLQKRLEKIEHKELKWHRLHGLDWTDRKQYDNVQRLRQRFTDDWIVIDGDDKKTCNQIFAQNILKSLKHLPNHREQKIQDWKQAEIPQQLTQVETEETDHLEYKKQLKKLTKKVAKAFREDSRRIVVVFEGMDAAGKGGAIKRIIQKLDPREYTIHTIAAPEEYELRHPYLWRFWTKLGQDKITIFDRSWYGRVLVERVEGFASPVAWQRAYDEMNRFEADLMASGTVVIKIWLAIDQDEQEKRFKAREQTPHKRFKITADDWRNRAKWDEYLKAAADMFERTSTEKAPWHLVATNNKKQARLAVLHAILKQLD